MGGTIALEMAQQLKNRGEEVALLALFDTINWSSVPAGSVWDNAYHQEQKLVFHAGNFLLLEFADKIRFLHEKLKVLQSRGPVWHGMMLRTFTRNRQLRSEYSVLAQVWEANDSAALSYVPRPYGGEITEYRPMKQYARYAGEKVKWSRLALGGHKIVNLPVYPAGMLLEPFVEYLAAALVKSIDGALRRVSGRDTSQKHQKGIQGAEASKSVIRNRRSS